MFLKLICVATLSTMMDARLTRFFSNNVNRKLLCTRFRCRPHNRCVWIGKGLPENILKPVLNIIHRFFVLWITVKNQLNRNLFALRELSFFIDQ